MREDDPKKRDAADKKEDKPRSEAAPQSESSGIARLKGETPAAAAERSRLSGNLPHEHRKLKPTINEAAWKGSDRGGKEFHVTEVGGRVTTVEGWLSVRSEKRTSADRNLQAETKAAAGPDNPDQPRDASHLLGFKVGGPAADRPGGEAARANLVIGDRRINQSYMGFEREIQSALENGKKVYCQAEVHWREGEKDPTHVTHRYFTEGSDGKPVKFFGEVTTKIDGRPAQTLGEAMRNVDRDLKAKDFYSGDRKTAANNWQH